ncbi:MAG: flagellar filament capping protein FliD [Gammaproteobacteria bacterium]
MSISSPGLGSGIDISALVSGLVSAEGLTKTQNYNIKEAKYQAEISAFGSLKGALASFQTSVKALQSLTDFQQRTANSTDTQVFTASVDSTATVSQYGIEVVQMARAQKLLTKDGAFPTSTTVVGAGTLKFAQGTETFSLTVSATDTVAELRDAINAATDNTGLTAAIINVDDGAGGTESKLVLTSNKTGLDNTITVTVDEDGNGLFNDAADLDNTGLSRLINANLDEPTSALDGQIKVDGQLISRENNTFSGVINGVTINGTGVGAGESLSVSLNKDAVTAKINAFITSYNKVVETFTSLGHYNATTESGGVLLGDSTLRGIQNALRTQISSSVSGLTGDSFSTLAEIGITTDKSGQLTLNTELLDPKLESNFDDLGQLFASTNGLSNTLDKLIEGYVSSTGIIDSRTDGLKVRVEDVSEQRVALNRRLASFESRLLAQFTAMDVLVSSLQNQSSFLTQQLANLPGAYNPNSN